jgi:prolipoprotein diacylglyceryltransferase
MTELQLSVLIAGFTVYYFVEQLIRVSVRRWSKDLHGSLVDSRKDAVFFGICMGALISLLSTPFCMRATWSALEGSSNDDATVLDFNAQVCIAARGVLWVSELNRLDLYRLYVVHHAGSIIALLSFLFLHWPPVIFLVLYSSLVSEIPGDFVWMLSAVEKPADNLLRFRTWLVKFNLAQYAAIRSAGLAVALWLLWGRKTNFHSRRTVEQAYGYILLILYAAFCLSYILRQWRSVTSSATIVDPTEPPLKSRKTQVLQMQPAYSKPSHLTIPLKAKIIILPYGPLMGLGFASLVVCTHILFAVKPAPMGAENLPAVLIVTLLSAVVGARAFSILIEDGGLRALFSHPMRTILRPGFWLHGGFMGAGFGASVACAIGWIDIHGVVRLASSLMVGLPLYEFWSRIGCHTYGCCYGIAAQAKQDCNPRNEHSPSPPPSRSPRPNFSLLWSLFPFPPVSYDHPTFFAATRIDPSLLGQPLVPIQLITSTISLLLFASVTVPILLSSQGSLESAGLVTFASHGLMRLVTERARADYRGGTVQGQLLTTTAKIAVVQLGMAMVLLHWAHNPYEVNHCVLSLTTTNVIKSLRAATQTSGFAFLLGTIVYGVHVGQAGRWR